MLIIQAPIDPELLDMTMCRGMENGDGCHCYSVTFYVTFLSEIICINGTALTFYSGDWINMTLDALEVFQIYGYDQDITGTEIFSDGKVSVMSGNQYQNVPNLKKGHGDLMVEQVFPVEYWGTEFITIPFSFHTSGDIFRFTVAIDNTSIEIMSNSIQHSYVLNSTDFFDEDIPNSECAVVNASKPIQVMQLGKSRDWDKSNEDPLMGYVPHTGQYYTGCTYIATPDRIDGTLNFTSYASVVILSSDKGLVTLNGVLVSPIRPWLNVPGSSYVVGHFLLSPEFNELCNTGSSAFVATVHGSVNMDENFAYPAALMKLTHSDYFATNVGSTTAASTVPSTVTTPTVQPTSTVPRTVPLTTTMPLTVPPTTTVPSTAAPTPTGVTQAPTGVTQAPTGVTQAPTGVTQAPTGVTQAPTAVTHAPTGVTQVPTAVTQAPTGVTQAPTGVTQAPTGVTQATKPKAAPATPTIPTPSQTFPVIAGVTGIVLTSALLLCCVLADIPNLKASLTYGCGNVRSFFASLCDERKRKKGTKPSTPVQGLS